MDAYEDTASGHSVAGVISFEIRTVVVTLDVEIDRIRSLIQWPQAGDKVGGATDTQEEDGGVEDMAIVEIEPVEPHEEEEEREREER